MEKFTILLSWLFILTAAKGNSQCIMTNQFPTVPIVSDNSGLVQEIIDCSTPGDFVLVTDLLPDEKYIFTFATDAGTNRYITVTDTSNNVIAHGISPLTVNAIPTASIRLHYSQDATSCDTSSMCHNTTIQLIEDLGMPSYENDTIVYPNPVKDILNVDYPQNISAVLVFNMLGQEVKTKTINAPQGRVDLSNVAAGTYLVKVVTDNAIKAVKVIKE